MDAKTLTMELAARLGREPHEIGALCEELGMVLGEMVAEGNSVAVPQFGTFEPKKRDERVAMHPSTGKKILIPPKLQMVFRPSAALKNRVRNKKSDTNE